MKHKKPTQAAFERAAADLGVAVAVVRAVFEVEAAGKFYNSNGTLPRRFEPHHFPKGYWGVLGFNPGNRAPWRASLELSKRRRVEMFRRACDLDFEAAHRAASWGAPQIMGFNYGAAGYANSVDMVVAFRMSADNQLFAFVSFVIAEGLDTHIRAHNWHGFAEGYNGTGQAAKYAAKIESAYARHSGQRSNVVLRNGAQGDAVAALQERLGVQADGSFGPNTRDAVIAYQRQNGLRPDGIVGAKTWEALDVETEKQPRSESETTKSVIDAAAKVGAGGVAGRFFAELGPTAELVLIGSVAVAVVVVALAWAIPRIRGAS